VPPAGIAGHLIYDVLPSAPLAFAFTLAVAFAFVCAGEWVHHCKPF